MKGVGQEEKPLRNRVIGDPSASENTALVAQDPLFFDRTELQSFSARHLQFGWFTAAPLGARGEQARK
jgi:hypothetical protein